jgi:hypothetical protein
VVEGSAPWLPPKRGEMYGLAGPPRGTVAALWVSGAGWILLGAFMMLRAFVGEEENCTANRGGAYQSCVRSSDITGLLVQALVIGLATAGLVLVLRGWRRRRGEQSKGRAVRIAAAVVGGLVVAGILLWVFGNLGGWEPDRPFPYEPIPTSRANAIMFGGVFVGGLVGALFPLGRPQNETAVRFEP